MTILDRILKEKKEELKTLKCRRSFASLKKEVSHLPKKKPSFLKVLKSSKRFAVIAELKKKSPSKGVISGNFDPLKIAKGYEKAGAGALSVLTDRKFFGGSAEILSRVRSRTRLAILRKDFILDEYQVWESRLMGADAILLIVSVLSRRRLKTLAQAAARLGLDVLFEVHSLREIEKLLPLHPKLVGINNRDLHTFRVDLRVTEKLMKRLPKDIFVVSESGIQTPGDLIYLRNLGVRAALVGESFMKEKNPGAALGRWMKAL